MFCLLQKHQWNAKLFHFWTFFCCKRRELLCSYGNGDLLTCYFRLWRYNDFTGKLVFHCCLYNEHHSHLVPPPQACTLTWRSLARHMRTLHAGTTFSICRFVFLWQSLFFTIYWHIAINDFGLYVRFSNTGHLIEILENCFFQISYHSRKQWEDKENVTLRTLHGRP